MPPELALAILQNPDHADEIAEFSATQEGREMLAEPAEKGAENESDSQ